MKKQSTLFPENKVPVLAELDLKDAEKVANQVKTVVCSHCVKIEIAGSIRRQKPKVHDIYFVVVTKSDFEWQKISEELRRLKAKPICQGSSVIKAFLPCHGGLFQVDFCRAQPSTFGIHLLARTRSAEHNMRLAGCAISKGMRIKYSEGLIMDSAAVAGKTEQGLFEALGLHYPMPSEREIVEGKPAWVTPENHHSFHLSHYSSKCLCCFLSKVTQDESGLGNLIHRILQRFWESKKRQSKFELIA